MYTLPTIMLRIFIPLLTLMHYGYDLFSQIYTILAVDESKQEVLCFYFQIKSSR